MMAAGIASVASIGPRAPSSVGGDAEMSVLTCASHEARSDCLAAASACVASVGDAPSGLPLSIIAITRPDAVAPP